MTTPLETTPNTAMTLVSEFMKHGVLIETT